LHAYAHAYDTFTFCRLRRFLRLRLHTRARYTFSFSSERALVWDLFQDRLRARDIALHAQMDLARLPFARTFRFCHTPLSHYTRAFTFCRCIASHLVYHHTTHAAHTLPLPAEHTLHACACDRMLHTGWVHTRCVVCLIHLWISSHTHICLRCTFCFVTLFHTEHAAYAFTHSARIVLLDAALPHHRGTPHRTVATRCLARVVHGLDHTRFTLPRHFTVSRLRSFTAPHIFAYHYCLLALPFYARLASVTHTFAFPHWLPRTVYTFTHTLSFCAHVRTHASTPRFTHVACICILRTFFAVSFYAFTHFTLFVCDVFFELHGVLCSGSPFATCVSLFTSLRIVFTHTVHLSHACAHLRDTARSFTPFTHFTRSLTRISTHRDRLYVCDPRLPSRCCLVHLRYTAPSHVTLPHCPHLSCTHVSAVRSSYIWCLCPTFRRTHDRHMGHHVYRTTHLPTPASPHLHLRHVTVTHGRLHVVRSAHLFALR